MRYVILIDAIPRVLFASYRIATYPFGSESILKDFTFLAELNIGFF